MHKRLLQEQQPPQIDIESNDVVRQLVECAFVVGDRSVGVESVGDLICFFFFPISKSETQLSSHSHLCLASVIM